MEEVTEPHPLDVEHILDRFGCERESLNAWLASRARMNEAYGASRTFVVCPQGSLEVVGYYCLSQGAVGHDGVSSKLRRNMPDPIPVTLLGRLAVDRRFAGKGLGSALLQDAFLRARQAATIVASRGILVHALDEEAKGFYLKFGFSPSPSMPMLLVKSFM